MPRTVMSLAELAAMVIRTYGPGDYAKRVYFALGDLKLADPELFDGSRSVPELVNMLPSGAL